MERNRREIERQKARMDSSSSKLRHKTRAVSKLALFLPLAICLWPLDFIALAQTAKRRSSAASQSSYDQLAKRAKEARDANRTDDAIALYRQALKTKAWWAEGRWHVGTLL